MAPKVKAIRVQILGNRGGVRSQKVFRGTNMIKLIRTLNEIVNPPNREDRSNQIVSKKPCDPHHRLRKGRARLDGMRTWTCRDCKTSTTIAANLSEFRASLSIIFVQQGLT